MERIVVARTRRTPPPPPCRTWLRDRRHRDGRRRLDVGQGRHLEEVRDAGARRRRAALPCLRRARAVRRRVPLAGAARRPRRRGPAPGGHGAVGALSSPRRWSSRWPGSNRPRPWRPRPPARRERQRAAGGAARSWRPARLWVAAVAGRRAAASRSSDERNCRRDVSRDSRRRADRQAPEQSTTARRRARQPPRRDRHRTRRAGALNRVAMSPVEIVDSLATIAGAPRRVPPRSRAIGGARSPGRRWPVQRAPARGRRCISRCAAAAERTLDAASLQRSAAEAAEAYARPVARRPSGSPACGGGLDAFAAHVISPMRRAR